MLLLNEIEVERKRAINGELTRAELRRFAETLASPKDISVMIDIASGVYASASQTPELGTWSAYFQGGLSGFGDAELNMLKRDDALALLNDVAVIMKECVLTCNDASAWRFLKEAGRLEQSAHNASYVTASEEINAIRATLETSGLLELENGTASVSAFLIKAFGDPRNSGKRLRTAWLLKQYADEEAVTELYNSLCSLESELQFAAMQCLVYFSSADIDAERFIKYATSEGSIKSCDNMSAGRFERTPVNVINLIGACAIRLRSLELLRSTDLVRGVEGGRLRPFLEWCTQEIETTARE